MRILPGLTLAVSLILLGIVVLIALRDIGVIH